MQPQLRAGALRRTRVSSSRRQGNVKRSNTRRWQRASHICCAADTETDNAEGYRETTEDEINARPLVADYMAQFEHDQQWEEDGFGDTGEIFGEYTPYNWIEFSDKDEHVIKHEYYRTINAPKKEVHDFFMEWKNIPAACDLIDTLVPDGLEDDVAQVMVFYRYRRTPILQILLTLRRWEDEDTVFFTSDDGMPFVAYIRLFPAEKDPENATEVILNIEYRMPLQLVDFVGKLGTEMHMDGIWKENLVVVKKLLEKELTLDSLEAYYEEHRLDSYNGDNDPHIQEQLNNIPDHVELDLQVYQDDEDKRQQETFIHNAKAMEELVEEGKYVECEEGWARADAGVDEIDIAEKCVAYYRYFHDQPEKADKEQLANVMEILRILTYSKGWYGLDGAPDPESKPFAEWDGQSPHWRGDARRAQEAEGKFTAQDTTGEDPFKNLTKTPQEVAEEAARAVKDAKATNEGEETAAEGSGVEDSDDGLDPEEREGYEAEPEEQGVFVEDVDSVEVLPPKDSEEEGPEPTAASEEEELGEVRKEFSGLAELFGMGESDDEPHPDDPREPLARPDLEVGPGIGPRDGFKYEPWRDAIDMVLDDDSGVAQVANGEEGGEPEMEREGGEEPEGVWVHEVSEMDLGKGGVGGVSGEETDNAIREFVAQSKLAVQKYEQGGTIEEAEPDIDEIEAEIKKIEDAMSPGERQEYEDMKERLGGHDIPWTSPYDDMLEDEMVQEHDEIAILDEDDNVIGHAPILSRHDAENMTQEEIDKYMNNLADAAGLKEEFEQMKEDILPKEEIKEEVFGAMEDMVDWQKENADKAGVTMGEFTDAAVASQETALATTVEEAAEKLGITGGQLMSTAFMFSDRTQQDADRLGVSHDQYLEILLEAMEEAEEEEKSAAKEQDMDLPTYDGFAARIYSDKERKAANLNMTVEEYEKYAWQVVQEAQNRDWTGDPDIKEGSDSELDEEGDWDEGPDGEEGAGLKAMKRMFGLDKQEEEERTPPRVGCEESDDDSTGVASGEKGSQ